MVDMRVDQMVLMTDDWKAASWEYQMGTYWADLMVASTVLWLADQMDVRWVDYWACQKVTLLVDSKDMKMVGRSDDSMGKR